MEISRLSLWERILGVAGAALALSPFLPWWSVDQVGESSGGSSDPFGDDPLGGIGDALQTPEVTTVGISGWEALSVIDIVVCLAGLAVLGLILAKAAGKSLNLPVAPAAVAGSLGLLAAVLTAYRGGEPPDIPGAESGGDSIGVPGVFEISTGAAQSDPSPTGVYFAFFLGALIAFAAWKVLREQGTGVREQFALLRERLGGQGAPAATGTGGAHPQATGATPPPPPPAASPPPPPPPPPKPAASPPPPPPPPPKPAASPPPPPPVAEPRPAPPPEPEPGPSAEPEPAPPPPAASQREPEPEPEPAPEPASPPPPRPEQRLGADELADR